MPETSAPAERVQRLLAASAEERAALLSAYQPLESQFFHLLKQYIGAAMNEDAEKALRAADVGLEASEFAADQEGVAIAWWAKGNILQFLLRHDDSLAAYSTAISIFAALGRAREVALLQSNCMPPLIYAGRYSEAQALGQSAAQVLGDQEDTPPVANLLLNRGLCAIYQGEHVQALEPIARAAAIFCRLEDLSQAARCWVTQAWALECLDRFRESEALLQTALRTLADHHVWMDWARVALNLGALCARLADHQNALRWFDESRQGFLKVKIEPEVAGVDLYRAQSLLDLNLLPEAATLIETLSDTFARLKMPREMAYTALLLAETHVRRGQLDLAPAQLLRARQVFCVEQDTVEVAQVDLRRAAVLLATGCPGEALRLATEAAGSLDVRHYPLRHAQAHLLVAACCEGLGRIEEAQVAYQVAWVAGAQPTGATEPPPFLAYRIAHARGVIAESAGDLSLARGEYDRAVAYLTRAAQGLGLDELRGGYLADKRAVYESAIRLALDDGRLADVFRYCELARAGAMRDLMAQQQRRPQAESAEQRTLEDLKARWAWRASQLRPSAGWRAEEEETGKPKDQTAQLRELASLEHELQDAYRRCRLADPRFTILEQGEVIELGALPRHLPPDAALLYLDHVGDQLFALTWVGGEARVTSLCGLDWLRREAVALRHALEEVHLFDDPTDVAMLQEDLPELASLYRALLAKPLEWVGPDVRRLLIVPCDALHTLPLEALYDGERHVLERYAVCYLPSASLLAALPAGRQAGAGCPLVLAHSWGDRLPMALAEAQQVADTLTCAAVRPPVLLTEEGATAQALRERAGSAGLLHIAAHGAFRADAPLFSALRLADGPLTVHDVYGLDLSRVALATLSGCQTGLGRQLGGEVLGLTHAFFFAGAPALAVSRWRVDDQTTAQLMQDFYLALLRGETVAEALRAAQLGVLARRPHPGYWAAFAAWGQGFTAIFPMAEK